MGCERPDWCCRRAPLGAGPNRFNVRIKCPALLFQCKGIHLLAAVEPIRPQNIKLANAGQSGRLIGNYFATTAVKLRKTARRVGGDDGE